jgi:hypothetical protein
MFKTCIRGSAGLGAAAATLLGLAAVTTTSAAGAASHKIAQKTCFWSDEVDSKFDLTPAHNYAFPDSGAVYWSANVTMPAGSRIVLKGKFPHARYESLNTYSATTHAPTDNLHDVGTAPDHGSTNPFKVGANRNATKRSYTITVLNQPAPPTRAANTLYAGVPGQTSQVILYRIYEPDSFSSAAELTGGVGLPTPVLHLADGTVQTGQAACSTLHAQSGPLPLTTVPKSLYEALRNQPGKPATFPAAPRPLFRAFYNQGFTIACWYQANCTGSPAHIGGQYSNIDNSYVAAFVNRAFPAGPVLVLHGKLPTTPNTGPDVKRMGTGQMRYWSICQNESLFTTKGAGCVYDAQIPVDKHGDYTIVTSRAGDRPKNATTKCGVAYLPWPKNGDGDGHLNDGLLLVRNMLPAASFHHAVQDTKTPGDEAAVMGAYYPRGTYTTKAAFQKKGC